MKSVLLFRYMQIYSDLWSTLDIAVCVHTYLFFVWCFFLCFFYWINLLFAIWFWDKFALLPASRQGEAAPGRTGAGVSSRKRGPQESFLFRRETGVEGVGTGLSFAAKTSRGPLGPREPPLNLLRVAGITWAGLIRKVHMLRLVVFSKNRKAVSDASFTASRRIAGYWLYRDWVIDFKNIR